MSFDKTVLQQSANLLGCKDKTYKFADSVVNDLNTPDVIITPWNYLSGTFTRDKQNDKQENIQLYDLLRRYFMYMVMLYEAIHLDHSNYVRSF